MKFQTILCLPTLFFLFLNFFFFYVVGVVVVLIIVVAAAAVAVTTIQVAPSASFNEQTQQSPCSL